jgi:tetratricopeptide (TPR) repeat protein
MTRLVIFIFLMAGCSAAIAQSGQDRSMVRQGNRHYNEGNYAEAELDYRRALEADPENARALFNLGNALYRQGRYDEAASLFDALTRLAPSDINLASAYHNLGNSHLGAQRYGEGIEAYKNALRISPSDDDTRYNLEYAMKHLQEPPPGEQQAGEGEGDGDESGETDPPQDQEEDQEGETRPQSGQLSRQEAERILDALNQMEQKVQESLTRENETTRPGRVEREW